MIPDRTEVARAKARPRPPGAGRLLRAISWTGFLLLAGLFVAFRPASLGGTATYTFIVGVSMEPTFRTGDLAIVVPQASYAIGDVVSFHPSAVPDGTIIHRIVGGDAGTGFVTQGDNRPDADPDRPTAGALVGKAVVVIPQAAWVLGALREPVVLGAIGAALAGWYAWDWMGRRQRTVRG